jgi:hypothetical protein
MWIILWLLGAFREYVMDIGDSEEEVFEYSNSVNVLIILLYLLWPFIVIYDIYKFIKLKLIK